MNEAAVSLKHLLAFCSLNIHVGLSTLAEFRGQEEEREDSRHGDG